MFAKLTWFVRTVMSIHQRLQSVEERLRGLEGCVSPTQHGSHWFEDGRCRYCGAPCPYEKHRGPTADSR